MPGFNPYSPDSRIWSADQAEPVFPTWGKALAIGAVVGAGALAHNYGNHWFQTADARLRQKSYGNDTTLTNVTQRAVRGVGYASPFQLLNTFRIAEFMSPFVTSESKGYVASPSILDPKQEIFKYDYSQDVLNRQTRIQIEQEFKGEFENLRKTNKLDFNNQTGQYEMRFEGKKGESVGKAFIREMPTGSKPGDWIELSDRVRTQEIVPYEAQVIEKNAKASKVSPTAFAYLQENGTLAEYNRLGMDPTESAEKLYTKTLHEEGKQKVSGRARWMLLRAEESVEGKDIFSKIDIGFNKLLRGMGVIGGFGMSRFNRLLESVGDHLPIVGAAQQKLESNFGISLKINPGKAHEMFAGFGLKSMKLLGAATAVSEIDHWRREMGVIGNIGASSITAAAATWGMGKLLEDSGTGFKAKFGLAAFAGQMILPGFNQGLAQGLYTTYANAQIMRGAVGEVTLMNSYRRTWEGLAPGSTSMYVGAAVGLGLAGASGFGFNPLANKIYESMTENEKAYIGISKLKETGVYPKISPMTQRKLEHKSKVDLLSEIVYNRGKDAKFLTPEMQKLHNSNPEVFKFRESEIRKFLQEDSFLSRKELSVYLQGKGWTEGAKEWTVLQDEIHARTEKSLEERRRVYVEDNKFNKSLINKIGELYENHGHRTGFFGRSYVAAESFRLQTVHAFFGASMQGEAFKKAAEGIDYKPKLGRWGTLFTAGMLLHGTVTGALLGTLESPGEISDIYAGRKLVPIKKSRFWEGGGTPMGGTEIDYYRPHHYITFMSRAKERATWGEREPSPIAKFFLKNFTYDVERRNYYTRPYPITGGAFEDIPVVGNILSATIGRIVKPPKLMHVNDYMREGPNGGIEFAHKKEKELSYALGGKTPGKPMSPFEGAYIAGMMNYQFRELEGMTGWAKNMITKAVTGEEQFAVQRPVMASAAKMYSMNDRFWDLNIGGGFLTTEPIRRFLPRKRSAVQEYNPIPNSMPAWMPNRFHLGDPYRSIEGGEYRLPGAGFEALHPELKGMDPDAYPDIYKYSILADVASQSVEFHQLRQSLYKRRAMNMISEKEARIIDDVDSMINQKQTKLPVSNVDPSAYEIPLVSDVSQGIYGGATKALRKGAAPIEFLVPMGFRPIQKLLPTRGSVEQYEFERLYGTQFSFWDKPIRDWFRPSFYSAANALGYDGVPDHRRRSNEINSYFDQLEFAKQMQLAENAGSKTAKYRHLHKANRTRYGVNPQGSALSIYEALPREDKKFFDAFSAAKGAERNRIMEMIPEDQIQLYKSIWKRIDNGDTSLYPGSDTQLNEQHLANQFYQIQNEGPMNGGTLPGQDWVGYRKDVSLDDIKLKYSERLAVDINEVGLYNNRRRSMVRKQYLNDTENTLFSGYRVPGSGAIRATMYDMRPMQNSRAPEIMNVFNGGDSTHASFYVNDNRSMEIRARLGNE